MKLRCTKAFRAHVRYLAEYFRIIVGAQEYRIDLDFERLPKNTQACISIDLAYLYATIKIGQGSVAAWVDKEFQYLAHIVCHEMCHILIEPLYMETRWMPEHQAKCERVVNNIEDVKERQTQRIANAIMSLVPESAWLPPALLPGGKASA